jgi:hypothetical protein
MRLLLDTDPFIREFVSPQLGLKALEIAAVLELV